MPRQNLALRSFGFTAYLAAQFLGALNDNAFKFAILAFITVSSAGDLDQRDRLTYVTQGLFAIPFVVLASWAGSLADRYRKSAVFVGASLAEIPIMYLGMMAFAAAAVPPLLAVLLLMSTQSTFFGPAKYGYLAETVPERDLSRANGIVNMTTFVAVVIGQVVGPDIFQRMSSGTAGAAWFFVAIAAAGFVCSLGVPRVKAARPKAKLAVSPLSELATTWKGVRANQTLLYTMAGIAHFYLMAALLQLSLFYYAIDVLGMDNGGIFVAVTLIGIAAGSLLAARWSEGKIELGLVPLGALAMSASVLVLAGLDVGPGPATVAHLWAPFACAFFTGVAGGLFSVPLNATLQHRAPGDAKGRYLAFGNMVSFLGILFSAVIWFGLSTAGLDIVGKLWAIGVLSLVGTVASLLLLPEAVVRFLGWLAAHTVYRIHARHGERLPARGGALIIANHVSWVDALVLAATTRRKLRFLLYRPYYEWWPVHWIFRIVGCIPVASGDSKEVLKASLDRAGQVLEDGHVVVIFAEGAVTRTGHMLPFRRGFQRIVAGRDVPIIPVHLDGLWGSVFSHERGRLVFKWPRAFPYPATVTFGEALPPDAAPYRVRAAIRKLAVEAWRHRRRSRRPLHVALLREERRSLRVAAIEPGGRSVSRGTLVARALALRDATARRMGPGRRVGVLLPQGVEAATAVLAVLYSGRVPVLLDPGLSPDALLDRVRFARIDTVITDARTIERTGLATAGAAELPELIDLSNAGAAVPRGRAWMWRAANLLLPSFLLVRLAVRGRRRGMDAPAAVVFVSPGGEVPRAVVLSHHGLLSNVEAIEEVVGLDPDETLVALQPFADPVGLAVGLWMPLLGHVRALWCAEPRDARTVGKAVARVRASVLVASPGMLETYLQEARPEHLGSLRLVLAMGSHLSPRLADAFADRFGIEPLACYTGPECGPVIAMNTPNVRQAGIFQRGTKHGSVGHPLPGISVEVVDPEKGHALPPGVDGALRVRSPDAEVAYLQADGGVVPVLRDGWFRTGDTGSLDEEGFLALSE